MTQRSAKELPAKCQDFLRKKESFRWFIVKYFGLKKFMDLWSLAEDGKEDELNHELNVIWHDLPDSIFNIRVNPKGWETFLSLVED